jgi:NAD(P)-dependent dehydrogenase (short-subunit alcohol dehydrogenase family)
MQRTVVVTGGTGALGRALAQAFHAAGDRVVVPWIVDRERDEVSQLWRTALQDGRALLVEADVADEAGAAELARRAAGVEVLVNAVGGFGGGTRLEDTPLELFDRMYRINVRSAVATTRALLPAMVTRQTGAIINVASQAAIDTPGGLSAYSASKAALIALTRTLQNELAATGVRVNAVVPTTIDTPANREAMPDADPSQWTPPERIAEVVLWLASDAGAAVRGGLIPV